MDEVFTKFFARKIGYVTNGLYCKNTRFYINKSEVAHNFLTEKFTPTNDTCCISLEREFNGK